MYQTWALNSLTQWSHHYHKLYIPFLVTYNHGAVKKIVLADIIYFTDAYLRYLLLKLLSCAACQSNRKWRRGRKRTDAGEQNAYSSFWNWKFPTKHRDGLAVITSFCNNMRIENVWWDDIRGFSLCWVLSSGNNRSSRSCSVSPMQKTQWVIRKQYATCWMQMHADKAKKKKTSQGPLLFVFMCTLRAGEKKSICCVNLSTPGKCSQ